jgi:hypothetical protein
LTAGKESRVVQVNIILAVKDEKESRMKSTLIVLALPLLVISICASAQANHRRDGNWWNGENQSEKLNYMVGFFDGMELGHKFSYWELADTKKTACMLEASKAYNDYSDKFFTHVTNDQLADGLDAFYKDYRNRSIRVHDAVWIVVNNIAGTPQEEMDKMIENWRKSASNE